MMTHHFRVTNNISPSKKKLRSDNRKRIINKFSFVHSTFSQAESEIYDIVPILDCLYRLVVAVSLSG